MVTINWGLNVQVAGGPQLVVSQSKSVEAYDKIEVVIDPSGGVTEVSLDIQPGKGTQVDFLLIKSSLYGSQLTYKVSDGTAVSKEITLGETHIYSGTMITALLPDPKILKFKNNHPAADATKKAAIEILVGRKATPLP